MDKPARTERIELFRKLCRERGERCTVQRRVILETVLELDNHPSADHIFDAVETRLPGIARTTVYRALEHLARMGVITKACHPGRVARFDPRLELHHHLVCLRCNEFFDFEDDALESADDPRHLGLRFRGQRLPRATARNLPIMSRNREEGGIEMRKTAFVVLLGAGLLAAAGVLSDAGQEQSTPLGLPPVPIPENNPQTPEKIALGEKLYMETRFSTTGEVGCFTCHDPEKAFTDSPLKTSEGINALTGTRNSPTVINSAYLTTQFWDGRSPDLEDQALHPFINPVEHGLKNHDPILKIVRKDPEYAKAFKEVFGKSGKDITMREVTLAIAAFERTVICR